MVETFEYDKRTGIDLPNEKISQTPKSWYETIVKREGKWSDIRTVFAAIGQDTVVVTPISMIRAISSKLTTTQPADALAPPETPEPAPRGSCAART
jgi:cell division protein FtsI/penicillin-binding protein 2